MLHKYNVSYYETNSKKWTPSAVDCYTIGCNCSKCNLYKLYFSHNNIRCRMKEAVFELVRKFGKPLNEEAGN